MRFCCLAALLLILTAAAPPPTGPRIFTVDAHLPLGALGTGLWRPSLMETAAAVAALRRYVHDDAIPDTNVWVRGGRQDVARDFENYAIQVMGVRRSSDRTLYDTEGAGPKQIHLNGLCAEAVRRIELDLAASEIQISDGGSCFFRATFDVVGKHIVFFMTNGLG